MSANNTYKVNLSTPQNGFFNIDLPINMTNQIVDQANLVETVFVDVETQNAINPIVDYEKVRYIPLDSNLNTITNILYNVAFTGTNTSSYADIGFTDDEVKYEYNSFLNSYLELYFYDSDNPFTQNLLFYTTLYSELTASDLTAAGWPKPADQIPVDYLLQNPYLYPRGASEGYYLYDYRDELAIGDSKYLYMRASFNNAKDGSSTNMMVTSIPQTIDNLVHQLYTRFILTRTQIGFYYQIDNTYQGVGFSGPNNVSFSTNQYGSTGTTATITLYKIAAI